MSSDQSGADQRAAPEAGSTGGATTAPPDEDGDSVAATATDSPATDEPEPVDVEHAPPRLTQFVAAGGAVLGAALTAPFVLLALPFGLAGAAIATTSAFLTHSRGWLTLGTGLVLVGAIITGTYGAVPPSLMLVSIGAAVLGWDVGQYGIVVGEQLGRQTRSRRIQVIHAATSAVVIGVISAVAYLVYLFAGSGRPAQAVALVVLGVIVLGWVFRS